MTTGQTLDIVILIINDGMGNAEKQLRHKLIRTYLTLLLEGGKLPAAICFYTEGVRLATSGSPVLDLLASIENKGTRLILCSTCLNYFGLVDQVKVGIIGGMGDIIEAQLNADKVITL
jgi:sulfur relay (sulfurtransferase) complex TusBCD TusD component (DsrE family)